MLYLQGLRCCQTSQERDISEDGPGEWTRRGRRGLLHYSSARCWGAEVECPRRVCYNHQFRRYDGFLYHVDLASSDAGLVQPSAASPPRCAPSLSGWSCCTSTALCGLGQGEHQTCT